MHYLRGLQTKSIIKMATIYGYGSGANYNDSPAPPDTRTEEEKTRDMIKSRSIMTKPKYVQKTRALLYELLWKKCKADINALKDPYRKSIGTFTEYQLTTLLKGKNVPLIKPDGSVNSKSEYRFPVEELAFSRTVQQLIQDALASTSGPIDLTIADRLIRAIDEAPQSEVIETVGSIIKKNLAILIEIKEEEAKKKKMY